MVSVNGKRTADVYAIKKSLANIRNFLPFAFTFTNSGSSHLQCED